MDIKIPEVGESVREALVAKWHKTSGDQVGKDEPICELETDKITLDLHADAAGVLTILVNDGTTVPIGTVIARLEEGAIVEPSAVAAASHPSVPSVEVDAERESAIVSSISSPSARRLMREQEIDPATLEASGRGGRITLDDLFSRIQESTRRPQTAEQFASPVEAPSIVSGVSSPAEPPLRPDPAHYGALPPADIPRQVDRRPMAPIRKRIAERLMAARQQTAMLTTFNEADLGAIKELRESRGDEFRQRHGVKLGYMPFFVRACCAALQAFPAVNASIDGSDIVYHRYCDIGVAVGGEKGLVVPVLRSAERLKLHEIEHSIEGFVEKVRTNRLAISDLEGGTFTISNGGIYGSMLSTPILNPPQSAVLGMHAIQERPVALDGQVVIRPMMYLALSYDHRIIDGKEAASFLKMIRELLGQPEAMLREG